MKSVFNWFAGIVTVWVAYCLFITVEERQEAEASALEAYIQAFKQSCINDGGNVQTKEHYLYCQRPNGNETKLEPMNNFSHKQIFVEAVIHKATFSLLT